jgi:hypothetical protein
LHRGRGEAEELIQGWNALREQIFANRLLE